MLVVEAKLKNGTTEQYAKLDDAIRSGQFIRNKCIRYWLDNKGTTRNDLQKLCRVLAQNPETPWAKQLNSQARQSSADRAWYSISKFYANCREKKPGKKRKSAREVSSELGRTKKGFPKFKKFSRSVEYKTTGWKLSNDRRRITFSDGFKAGTFDLWCSNKTLVYYSDKQIRRVRVVRRADGYYCQFLIDWDRAENREFNGCTIGIDLGLKEFLTDSNGGKVKNPRFLRKSERKLKRAQRRLSKRFKKGKKQSKNYHKQRQKVALLHLKVSRQLKIRAIKDALALVQSNDLVVYENLRVQNLVKNHKLAKSISDASWYQFTQWVNYFGKIYGVTIIAVPPHFTTQDCSVCGTRVEKTLSTRTHNCPNCKTSICRDKNAAKNILSKGLKLLGEYLKDTAAQGIGTCSSNAWGTRDWIFNGDIKNLSRLVEPGISNSDVERIPRL